MATKFFQIDFRSGMIDEAYRRRSDMAGFYNSASLIMNALPMRAGGVRLRPGLRRISVPIMNGDGTPDAFRIINYTKSADVSAVIILGDGTIRTSQYSSGGLHIDIPYGNLGYPKDKLSRIRTAQDYERLILVDGSSVPLVATFSVANDIFSYSIKPLELNANWVVANELNPDAEGYTYDYNGLFTENNFPSAVAFMAQRLWFMSSEEKPYKMWASRPFEYDNFQMTDLFEQIDESISAKSYLELLESTGTSSQSREIDETKYIITTVISIDFNMSLREKTVTVKDSLGDVVPVNEIPQAIKDEFGITSDNPLTTREDISEQLAPTYSTYDAIREDCAMEIEMASDRDETISWLSAVGDMLMVGTASSEWGIPASSSATTVYTSKMGSFGSAKISQSVYGNNSVYYIMAGRKAIRAITMGQNGMDFSEPTVICSSLFESGIKEIHWQRVPEPRLYALLDDGSIAVFCKDDRYGVSAWCHWVSDIKAESMCVIDTAQGQDVILLGSYNGETAVYRFDDTAIMDISGDTDIPYKATIVTNNIESESTLSYTKKAYKLFVDSDGTPFKAKQDGSRQMISPRVIDSKLSELGVYSRSDRGEFRLRIESEPSNDFRILAVVADVEVS